MEEAFNENNVNDKLTKKHRDVDGGYAWVILFASFMCCGLTCGFKQIFGILYTDILDMYQAGRYPTSWIITIQVLHWGLMGRKDIITLLLHWGLMGKKDIIALQVLHWRLMGRKDIITLLLHWGLMGRKDIIALQVVHL